MTTAGYSGKPLATKLGLRPGMRVLLAGAPAGFVLESPPEVTVLRRAGGAPVDLALAFCADRATLGRRFATLPPRVATAGMLWIAWPKRTSGLARPPAEGGIDENVVREVGLAAGLVDVKVIAVDETWSGLKFVRRLRDR